MAALDFREIAKANGGLERDEFELFAKEVLTLEGFQVIDGPDRGADGGRDLIVQETRAGPGGQTTVRWLVSCKHNAHGGQSVKPADEPNIRDRLETHACSGLIAFYSTLPSSGLSQILEALRPRYELARYDAGSIERKLLDGTRGRALVARFFPVSFNKWIRNSQHIQIAAAADPQRLRYNFFIREPHTILQDAQAEATERGLLLFVVIFDAAHPTNSKLNFSLGYFMEYQTTKRLVDEHFVAVVGDRSKPDLAALVPADDPLENCLWVVLDRNGKIIRSEGIYANPDEGLKRVRAVIAQTTA